MHHLMDGVRQVLLNGGTSHNSTQLQLPKYGPLCQWIKDESKALCPELACRIIVQYRRHLDHKIRTKRCRTVNIIMLLFDDSLAHIQANGCVLFVVSVPALAPRMFVDAVKCDKYHITNKMMRKSLLGHCQNMTLCQDHDSVEH